MNYIDENQVVHAVCNHLTALGYGILERRHTTEKGIDIVANRPDGKGKLYLEAKGGTSSRSTSARFGKGYSSPQVFDRVAKGVFTGLSMRCEHATEDDEIGLAYPDSIQFQKFLRQVGPALHHLGITIFLVQPDMSVVHL